MFPYRHDFRTLVVGHDVYDVPIFCCINGVSQASHLQEDLNIPIDLGLSVCCHLIRLVPRHLPLKGKAEKLRKSKASP